MPRGLVALACLIAASVTTVFAQSPVSAAGARDAAPTFSMIFTAFFVMLGPVKIIGPFASLTSDLSESELRTTVLKASLFACGGGVVAAAMGQSVLMAWQISLPALHLTAGVVLLLVALNAVLSQYEPPVSSKPAAPPRNLALSPLAFPTILPPHGIAVLILVLAASHDPNREFVIILLFFAVMAIDWVVMRFARSILQHTGVVLAVLGAVLGVLQVALAVQIMINALRALQVLPPQ